MFDAACGGRRLYDRYDYQTIKLLFNEQVALFNSLTEQIRLIEFELADELEVFDKVNEKDVRFEV
jgi:hypothetical protein